MDGRFLVVGASVVVIAVVTRYVRDDVTTAFVAELLQLFVMLHNFVKTC